METIYEKTQEGQHAYSLPKSSPDFEKYKPKQFVRKSEIELPEVSEIDLTRHFAKLASRNMGIDTNFYPLGSCTMKLNPRINEQCAALPNFTKTHPLAPEESVQGNLQVMDELIRELCKVGGMSAGTLVPNAGAQGEYTGLQMIRAYHLSKGDVERNEMLIPDNAHGTNPATASMAGFKTISIKTNAEGDLDLEDLKSKLSSRTAGLMLTNPSTLGLFSPQILEVAAAVHNSGGLLYYDGANLNAIMYKAKPGEMGFDVMHINLHKTFSTPHGGGGPGSGTVLCNQRLAPFLPVPKVEKKGSKYQLIWEDPSSIGHMATFHGNFAIYLRAYVYLLLHGHFGLQKISEQAVLNANYLKHHLGELFTVPFKQHCMHEFVLQADTFQEQGIKAYDIAKRMLDYGIHAPTVYFPLIIKECMLIEPTESESLKTLDAFIDIMRQIVQEIKTNPEIVKNAPHSKSVKRLDEVKAARDQKLKCF